MRVSSILKGASACFVIMVITASIVSGEVSVPVTVTEPSGVIRTSEGIHSGIPFKKGEMKSIEDLILVDSSGKPVPVQFETLSRWDDGSLRWVLLNFRESLDARETKTYTLRTRKKNEIPADTDRVTVTDINDVFTVNTGRIIFDIPIYSSSIIANIRIKDAAGNWKTISKEGLEAVIWRTGIKKFKSRIENCTVESAGPLKSVIKIEGHHLLWDHTTGDFDPSEIPTFAFIMRVFSYAGSDEIQLQYTFINDNRDNKIRPSERYHVYAMEELADYMWVNGHWVERPEGLKFREQELLDDDYGQVNVKNIKLHLTLDDVYTQYRFGVDGKNPVTGTIDGAVTLEQLGPVHKYDYYFKEMPYPQIPFKAIVMHSQNQPSNEFDKAEGWVIMDGAASSVFVGSKFFWQYHPKIYAINEKELEFFVWSDVEDLPDPEIGFAKTHEVTIKFGKPSAPFDTGSLMAELNKPLMAVTTPELYMSTSVFGTYKQANETMRVNAEYDLLAANENSVKTRETKKI